MRKLIHFGENPPPKTTPHSTFSSIAFRRQRHITDHSVIKKKKHPTYEKENSTRLNFCQSYIKHVMHILKRERERERAMMKKIIGWIKGGGNILQSTLSVKREREYDRRSRFV